MHPIWFLHLTVCPYAPTACCTPCPNPHLWLPNPSVGWNAVPLRLAAAGLPPVTVSRRRYVIGGVRCSGCVCSGCGGHGVDGGCGVRGGFGGGGRGNVFVHAMSGLGGMGFSASAVPCVEQPAKRCTPAVECMQSAAAVLHLGWYHFTGNTQEKGRDQIEDGIAK